MPSFLGERFCGAGTTELCPALVDYQVALKDAHKSSHNYHSSIINQREKQQYPNRPSPRRKIKCSLCKQEFSAPHGDVRLPCCGYTLCGTPGRTNDCLGLHHHTHVLACGHTGCNFSDNACRFCTEHAARAQDVALVQDFLSKAQSKSLKKTQVLDGLSRPSTVNLLNHNPDSNVDSVFGYSSKSTWEKVRLDVLPKIVYHGRARGRRLLGSLPSAYHYTIGIVIHVVVSC